MVGLSHASRPVPYSSPIPTVLSHPGCPVLPAVLAVLAFVTMVES